MSQLNIFIGSDADRDLIESAAKQAGMRPTAFGRLAILSAARAVAAPQAFMQGLYVAAALGAAPAAILKVKSDSAP